MYSTHEGVTSAPEGVGLVLPLALLLVLLPSLTKSSERVDLLLGSLGEQVTIGHRVQDPVPVLLGDIGNEPGDLLSVEDDLRAGTRLDEPVSVNHVTVQFETGIVEDKVDSAILDGEDVIGEFGKVVSENVLLSGGEVVTTGRLELLNVLLGHVNEKRQVGRVTPETDYVQL